MDKESYSRAISGALSQVSEIGEQADRWLAEVCPLLEQLTEAEELEFVNASACKTGLSVVLECDDELLMENGRSHPFFSLIGSFDAFSFSKAADVRLRITLTMSSAWVK